MPPPRQFGTTVDAIVQANHIPNPNLIYVGQILEIPGVPSQTPPVVGPNARLETLMSLISNRPAVVIVRDDRVEGILTKIDILDYLSSQIR